MQVRERASIVAMAATWLILVALSDIVF